MATSSGDDEDKGKGKSDEDTYDDESEKDEDPKDAPAEEEEADEKDSSEEADEKDSSEEADEKDSSEEEEEGAEEAEADAKAEKKAASDDAGAHVEAAPKKATAKGDKAALGEAAASKVVARTAVAKPVQPPRAPPSAGLGKSVMLFILVVGGISLLMLVLGNEKGQSGPAAPKWSEGQTVDVDITLVSTDLTDLACASGTEVKGLHCAFESQTRRWSKRAPGQPPGPIDLNTDSSTVQPYSTTTGQNLLAANIWADLKASDIKLPNTRFALKCKFQVEGKMPRADVRWHEGEGWNNVTDWFIGRAKECKIGSVQN